MSNLILQYSIINGIILLCIQLYKKKSFTAAKYYILLYLAYILVVAEQLYINYLIFRTSWYAYCEFPIHFVFSPLAYLYVATYLNPQYRPGRKRLILLFFPAIIDIICFTGLCLYVVAANINFEQKLLIAGSHPFYLIRTGIASAYSLCITIRILKMIKLYLQDVKKLYADTGKIKIRWLQSISLTSIAFWVICFAYFIAELFFQLPRTYYIPLFILLSLLIIVQGYFVVLKPDMVFELSIINKAIKENKEAENEFLEKGKINDEDAAYLQALFIRIEKYINEEKAYTNNSLSLSIIAEHLDESTSMITKAIRHGYKDSFYNYVNRTRALRFLEELPKPENEIFTLETLSVKCGYNSKATLHKYFKELTGLTPAVAQKKLKNKEATLASLITNKGSVLITLFYFA